MGCWARAQAAVATSSLNVSDGAIQPSVSRGRSLSSSAMASSRRSVTVAKSRLRGRYWRSSPLGVLVGAALPGRVRIGEVHGDVGGDREAEIRGHLLALIPGQRSAQLLGQLDDLDRHCVTHRLALRSSGSRTSSVNRVVRSTIVAIWDLPARPRMRSPSQWPGTARSSTSGGRSEIGTVSVSFPRVPLPGLGPLRRRRARPVRSASVSSARRPPDPGGRAPGRASRGTPTSVAHPDARGAAGWRSARASASSSAASQPHEPAAGQRPAGGPWADGPARRDDAATHSPGSGRAHRCGRPPGRPSRSAGQAGPRCPRNCVLWPHRARHLHARRSSTALLAPDPPPTRERHSGRSASRGVATTT